jgi:hypothetical protein
MKLDEGMDTGDILLRASISVTESEAFFQKPVDNRQLFVAIKKALGESEDLPIQSDRSPFPGSDEALPPIAMTAVRAVIYFRRQHP